MSPRLPSNASPLLVVSTLACVIAACSKPEPAPMPAPAAEAAKPAPAEPAKVSEPPAAPALPVLHELDETQRAEVLVADSTHCNLESADGVAFAADDLSLTTPNAGKATGWLRAAGGDAATPESPTLRFESDDKTRMWDVPVALTIARDDLGTGGTPGFSVEFDAGALPSGRYHLYLAYRAGGTLHGCDNGRHVSIL